VKVLHISTSDRGGAGIAALRLHKSFMQTEIRSKFLCLEQTNHNVEDVYQYNRIAEKKPSFFRRFLRKFKVYLNLNEKLLYNANKDREEYEIFTSPLTDYKDIYKHPLIAEADIIHLHWIANFVDYPTFFSKVDKPIIWTLHDFNPDQGGYHLKYDQINSKHPILNELEKEVQLIKRESYLNSNITIVCPSKWFQDKLDFTILPKGSRVETIFHSIDKHEFNRLDKLFSKKTLKVKKTEYVFVFVASDLTRKAKGFELLISSLDKLSLETNFKLLAVGRKHSIERDYLKYLGIIEDNCLLSLIYSTADAFISTSVEESFSLTAAEAMQCGIPIISTKVGFMAELVTDGVNGFLIHEHNSESIYLAIKNFIHSKDILPAEAISQLASTSFSIQENSKKYINLYKSVLSNSVNF
jgi:glycosyltransferase involved in cell wall biosynthesis